jgi:NADH dehydrogenase
VAVGDVHDEATLARMLRNTDAVINLVAILHGSEDEFERTHVRLPARLAAACQDAGVRRVIHVSALGAATDAPSRYLRSKARGEAALKAAALDLTILRPSVIFGERDRFLNLFAQLQSVFPVLPLAAPRRASSRSGSKTWRARSSPRSTTRARSARRSSAAARASTPSPSCARRRPLVGLARPVLRLPAALAPPAGLLHGAPAGTPLMSRDNLDSMRVANVASGKLPGLERLGIEPAPLEAIAPRYLGHVSGRKAPRGVAGAGRRG